MPFDATASHPAETATAWLAAAGKAAVAEQCILATLGELRDKCTYAPPIMRALQSAAVARPVPHGVYERTIEGMVERGKLALVSSRGLARILSATDARNERGIVDAIRRFRAATPPPVDRSRATDEQRAAIRQALSASGSIIISPPGSGKTTIVGAIVAAATAVGLRVALSCSTGIAALRLANVTKTPAATVHRLLRTDPDTDETLFRRTADNPLAADLVIVDECSMLDLVSLAGLLEAIQAPTRLVLIGDPYHLPPPGAGTPFLDLAETKALPTTNLTYSFRNERLIPIARQRIQSGFRPLFDNKELSHIRPYSSEHAARTAVQILAAYWSTRDEEGRPAARLMTPMHVGALGTSALYALAKCRINRFGDRRRLDVSDPVLQTKNDYTLNVFNGQTGTVIAHNAQNDELVVRFHDVDDVIAVNTQHQKRLELAYAKTFHESQGVQTPIAIVVLPDEAESMIAQDPCVTALTRSQSRAYVIASDRALDIAVSRRSTQLNLGTLKAALVQP